MEEKYYPVKWAEVAEGDFVYINGKHKGEFKAYGPHKVIDVRKKKLCNSKGMTFLHYAEDLLFGPRPTTAKYSHKMYQCKRCGHEESIGTNHWGEIYGPCKNCNWKNPMDGNPTWKCLEEKPAGYDTPPKWQKVKLGDVFKIVVILLFIGVSVGTNFSRADCIQDAIASHIAYTNRMRLGSNYLIVSEYGENGKDLFEVREAFPVISPIAPNMFILKVKSPLPYREPIRPMKINRVSTFRERRK